MYTVQCSNTIKSTFKYVEQKNSAALLSISCTLFLHCWLPVFLQTALCSGAGVRTVWAAQCDGPFFERNTSWTPLSTPPSAASETPLVAQISASSFSYLPERWPVSTWSLWCGEEGQSVRGLPAGGLFFGRSTAWRLLSRLPSSASELPLAAPTSARSSSCSWGEVRKDYMDK